MHIDPNHPTAAEPAEALARVDREAAAALLVRLASERNWRREFRVEVAEALARVDEKAGAALLARLASDS